MPGTLQVFSKWGNDDTDNDRLNLYHSKVISWSPALNVMVFGILSEYDRTITKEPSQMLPRETRGPYYSHGEEHAEKVRN